MNARIRLSHPGEIAVPILEGEGESLERYIYGLSEIVDVLL